VIDFMNIRIKSPGFPQPIRINRVRLWLTHHWLLVINLLIAIWVGLPWLAPIFMHWGWHGAAGAIYFFYSFQCHQLPERSFFLFGRQPMYSLNEIRAVWPNSSNFSVLRQFIGNADMGWKVAWSDRMVYMDTSILVAGVLYGAFRGLRPLSLRAFALLLIPMAIDGGTHLLSDLGTFGQGFRDTNAWLTSLTGNVFSSTFYGGDALGSFNSWARLISGVLFGIAVAWLLYPNLNDSVAEPAFELENKLPVTGYKA
jgi:uncharacterized membrane protein